jgi:hypothetical protein
VPRARAPAAAHAIYMKAAGILYASSMNGGEPALTLNNRAEKRAIFPAHPLFHPALADDVLLDTLKHAAHKLGYALR